MDKLEQYIRDNRESLDRHIPDPEIWMRIQEDKPAKSLFRTRLLKYAAIITIIIGSALVYLGSSGRSARSLSSPELLESELYYSNKVKSLMDEAKPLFTSNPLLKDELMLEISMLDSIYLELKEDLKDNVSNTEVIEALILNYRVKIGILEEMLDILKDQSNNDEERIRHEL